MASESQKRAIKKYQKEKLQVTRIKFNKVKDKDILDKLASVPSKIDYIRTLIRNDLGK